MKRTIPSRFIMVRTTPIRSTINIMTNDPSMREWGWAVLDINGLVVATGAIQTKPIKGTLKGVDRIRRITIITTELLRVLRKYNIKYIVSELPHGSQSASAAVMVGTVGGLLQALSLSLNIGIEWYSEGDSKLAISGKRSLKNKDEMVRLIDKKYKVTWQNVKWIDHAVADALAVHHVAMKQSTVLKYL